VLALRKVTLRRPHIALIVVNSPLVRSADDRPLASLSIHTLRRSR
jgi:hypothetical protein